MIRISIVPVLKKNKIRFFPPLNLRLLQGADQLCIVGLLAKMAVDRTLNSSMQDAREAFINVCVDTVSRYRSQLDPDYFNASLYTYNPENDADPVTFSVDPSSVVQVWLRIFRF